MLVIVEWKAKNPANSTTTAAARTAITLRRLPGEQVCGDQEPEGVDAEDRGHPRDVPLHRTVTVAEKWNDHPRGLEPNPVTIAPVIAVPVPRKQAESTSRCRRPGRAYGRREGSRYEECGRGVEAILPVSESPAYRRPGGRRGSAWRWACQTRAGGRAGCKSPGR